MMGRCQHFCETWAQCALDNGHYGLHETTEDVLDHLRAENARLREALRRYGQHTTECREFMHDEDEPCTCGLDDAVADGEGEL